jgi:hypothetical protein
MGGWFSYRPVAPELAAAGLVRFLESLREAG